MALLAWVLATVASSPAWVETPRLFREETVSPLMLAEAVNHYVALGEEAAIKELKTLWAESGHDIGRESRTRWRIGWVCRILYQPKGETPIRQPYYGSLSLPETTMPLETWPLYPIALSGSSYFVLHEGYSVAGLPEDPMDYVAHCRTEGQFRKKPIPLPDRDQALKDAGQLRRSAAWKAIKWKDQGKGFRYSFSESRVWRDIEDQAKAIPEQ